MSELIYEAGEVDAKFPLCTTCNNFTKGECKIYKKDIPREIRFEFASCKHYDKIKGTVEK